MTTSTGVFDDVIARLINATETSADRSHDEQSALLSRILGEIFDASRSG